MRHPNFNMKGVAVITNTGRRIALQLFAILSLCAIHAIARAESDSGTRLREQFVNPPVDARPRAFWPWLNGNVDRDRIVYEMDQMQAQGMGGGEVWDVAAMHNSAQVPAGPEFLSEKSAADIRFALQEGRKRDFRMGMITSSGWNAGGTWVSPDWASKLLVYSSVVTSGGKLLSQALPFPDAPEHCPKGPDGLPLYYKDIAVVAVPESAEKTISSLDQAVVLTDKLDTSGTLTWQVPPGDWRIFRFVCTNTGQHLIVPSPNSNGLFIDFLDPNATRRHLKIILDKLQITPANAHESGLNYLEVDSMELHPGNPWTDKFSAWFSDNVGYNLTPWLPALAGWTIKDKANTDAFIYDYRKAVSNLLIHSHYETGSAFLKDYGIDFVGEAGGPGPPIWDTCPVDALKALGNVTVPRGEFWIQHRNMFLIKEVASAAHIYGKPIVDAESFTTWRRYEDSPFELKKSADRAFAEGLNQLTIHTFAHSPKAAGMPGNHYHAGIDINPNTTWWPFARPFMDYMSRCSFMLRQGLPVADVLWYYGDQAPNFFPAHHDVPAKPRLPGLAPGYDYDVINSDVILNRLQVKDGNFVLPEGTTYRVLAFPDSAVMSPEVLERLAQLVRQGGIILGNPRVQSPGINDNENLSRRMKELSAELWGDSPTTGAKTVGKGKAYHGLPINQVLKKEGVPPDFAVVSTGTRSLDFIHRRAAGQDIYFVRNTADTPVSATVAFRTIGTRAGQWHPDTGHIEYLRIARSAGYHRHVNLKLSPGEATFMVFGYVGDVAPPLALEMPVEEETPVAGPWTLSPISGPVPFVPAELSKLESWTESNIAELKYFSGTAEYNTTITATTDELAKTGARYLALGKVGDVARVLINGSDAGIAWKPPYNVNITDLLRAGENTVTVQVANQWHNRLVKDSTTSATERATRTNLNLKNKENAPLLPSGLMGPVSIIREYENHPMLRR